MITRASVPCLALLAVAAAGCATLNPAASNPPTSVPDVQDQLFKVQKDTAQLLDRMTALEQRLGGGGGGNACAEAAARSEHVEKQMQVLQEQFLATQQRLDSLAAELRRARPAAAARPADVAPAPSGTAPPPEAARTPGVPAPAGSPEDQFNAAYADYSRGNYDLALAGFEACLRVDPQGPLADDAQYWIGESLYAKNQFLEAAAAFEKVITGWPTGDKLPVSHLKRGLALYEARRTTDGVAELKRVIETWPGSDEARLARDFLKRKGAL